MKELDQLQKQIRESNLIAVAQKLMNRTRGQNVKLSVPPEARSSVAALINDASEEDDDEIQELWAGLMYRAFHPDPAQRQRPKRVFRQMLKSMEPIDAALLRFLSKAYDRGTEVSLRKLAEDLQSVRNDQLSMNDVRLSLFNLAKLNCITYVPVVPGWADGMPDNPILIIRSGKEQFYFTDIAISLLEACDAVQAQDVMDKDQDERV